MEIAVAYLQMRGPACQGTDVMKHGITAQRKPRSRGKNPSWSSPTFLVEYSHWGRVPAVKQQVLEMPLNGRGIRDIARVRHISPTTVIEAFKKSASDSTHHRSGNPTDRAPCDHREDSESGRSGS